MKTIKYKIDENLTLEGDRSFKTYLGIFYIKYILLPYVDYILAPIFRFKLFLRKWMNYFHFRFKLFLRKWIR